MKKQVVIIHGGNIFENYNKYLDYLLNYKLTYENLLTDYWKENLKKELLNFEVVYPQMPSKSNARYTEWKIWFEKIIPFLREDVVLIGHSLGGIFLAKYLSENTFPVKISSTHLVAAPFEENGLNELLGDFVFTTTLKKFAQQAGSIYLYFSKDDATVPFSHLSKYKEQLPKAHEVVFEDRGHFKQEKFPELVKNIQK